VSSAETSGRVNGCEHDHLGVIVKLNVLYGSTRTALGAMHVDREGEAFRPVGP